MANMFDPDLKLKWAKKHLDALAIEVDIFRKSNKYVITTQDDLENGWYVIRFQLPYDDRSFTIALMAGDFIACLRSCLDHLAWQLALFSGKIPTREICFPICDKDTVDTQVKIARSTFGIPDAAVTIMKAFQPYKSGDDYKSTYLWRLNELWNIDKHRHIAPHGAVTDWLFKLDVPEPTSFPVKELDDGGIMNIPIALKDKVQFNPTPGEINIFFGDKPQGLEAGIEDFFRMHQFIADTVFPAFSSFFPK